MCINSSKVYCKLFSSTSFNIFMLVLIVAKCIVNYYYLLRTITYLAVLIVAKCIVNPNSMHLDFLPF